VTTLDPGQSVAASALTLDHVPVPADQVVSGNPTTGLRVLDERDGREIGIWEMTPGTANDTESDEVFIVLGGRATVRFEDGAQIELGAGSVVRLSAGMRTTWVVHETLRKVYVA